MDKTLSTISERIEGGDGFLTLVETLKVETDIAAIDDEDVRNASRTCRLREADSDVNELPAR